MNAGNTKINKKPESFKVLDKRVTFNAPLNWENSFKPPVMSITIDDYRCKLINKILFSGSPDEVRRFINTAMKSLEEHKVNGYIIVRFVNKMILDLEQFDPANKNAMQCNNIEMAKTLFKRIKLRFEPEPYQNN